jgi:hypothetical protein
VQEGEVVGGFAFAAGGDPASCFEPGVGAFDWLAVAGVAVAGAGAASASAPHLATADAGRDRLAGPPRLADPRLDLAPEQRLLELAGGVAAVGQQLAGLDPAGEQRVDQRQQVAALVLVPGRQPQLQRPPSRVDG